MEDNNYSYNNNTYNDPEQKRNPLINVLKIVLIVLAVFVVIILLVKACGSKSNYNDLLEAGKKYFTISDNEMPTAKGVCKTVTLGTLKEENLLNSNSYSKCDRENTFVKVCILDNGDRQYVPVLSCDNVKTTFEEWRDGTSSDIVKDASDVEFKFKATVEGEKIYYPNDYTDASKVAEYYVDTPKEGYTNKDGEGTTVYKWYSTKSGKSYWNGGATSTTQPAGYPYSESMGSNTLYSTTNPGGNAVSVTLYRTQAIAHIYKYACTDSKASGIKYTSSPCNTATDGFTKFVTDKFTYTCGVKDANGYVLVNSGTVCSNDYSGWTETVCKTNLLTGIKCESQAGYKYTATTYRWYKTFNANAYYPSLAATAALEKTYYTQAPGSGYVKDENTKATGYKYYKLVDKDGNIIDKNVNLTDGFVSEEDFIKACQDAGYEVTSINDIANNKEITYEISMQYRNRKD